MLSHVASCTYLYNFHNAINLDKVFYWLFEEDFNVKMLPLLKHDYKIIAARYEGNSKGEYSLKGKGFHNSIELIFLKQGIDRKRIKVKIFKTSINIITTETSRPSHIAELILNMLKCSPCTERIV